MKMVCGSKSQLSCLAIIILLSSTLHISEAKNGMKLKTDVFLSPKFELEPGSVANKYYYGIDFPKGHIAIKSFNAEVVDERGNPIPLHETYLHHWLVEGYHSNSEGEISLEKNIQSDVSFIRNNGLCDGTLGQYFGLGSETRRTSTDVPDPYGIEVGKPADAPSGWLMNVHAIDTRGAEDKFGCLECRCDLYNVTANEDGSALPPSYRGGLRCCLDGARCRVKKGFEGEKRGLYLKYTVTYVDWDDLIIPVQIYVIDVTDIWTKADQVKGIRESHHCLIEYDVEACSVGTTSDGCIHTRSLTVSLPTGGDVVYGVGHLHAGGVGTALYGEGGREICSSFPTYGTGQEPGNEAGYIVGMSTCYPSPGSVKISAGETLTLVSNYSSAQSHTGVMSLFYILLADSSAKTNAVMHSAPQSMMASSLRWPIALFGAGIVLALVLIYSGKNGRDEGYEEI